MSEEVPLDEPIAGQAHEVRQIAAELLPLFYQELKRAAHRSRTRMGAGVTLQTTAPIRDIHTGV